MQTVALALVLASPPFPSLTYFSLLCMMHRTIPIENGRQLSIVIASSISISIAVIAVGLRLAAKRIRNRVDGSDWCIVVACVSFMLPWRDTGLVVWALTFL